MFDTISSIAQLALLGFAVFQIVSSIREMITARREIAALEERLAQLRAGECIAMAGEGHSGVVYLYELGTGKFICQGKTLDEINNMYKLRFPLKRGAIVELDESAQAVLHEDLLIEDITHAGRT